MNKLLGTCVYNDKHDNGVISQNISRVQNMIHESMILAGRDISSVQLMGVSKTVPMELILEAHCCGQILFGENKVQEATKKFTEYHSSKEHIHADHHGYQGMQLHLIGSLQSNKVSRAVKFFDCIQSVDRMSVLDAVITHIKKNWQYDILCEQHSNDTNTSGHGTLLNKYPIYLQVRSSDYDYKHGFDSTDMLFQAVEHVLEHDCLFLKGLMTIGPFSKDECVVRRAFEKTRCWKNIVQEQFKIAYPLDISMGMSDDFTWAILEGSTLIRIGSRIFGERT